MIFIFDELSFTGFFLLARGPALIARVRLWRFVPIFEMKFAFFNCISHLVVFEMQPLQLVHQTRSTSTTKGRCILSTIRSRSEFFVVK
jgi:hypothetical protein